MSVNSSLPSITVVPIQPCVLKSSYTDSTLEQTRKKLASLRIKVDTPESELRDSRMMKRTRKYDSQIIPCAQNRAFAAMKALWDIVENESLYENFAIGKAIKVLSKWYKSNHIQLFTYSVKKEFLIFILKNAEDAFTILQDLEKTLEYKRQDHLFFWRRSSQTPSKIYVYL